MISRPLALLVASVSLLVAPCAFAQGAIGISPGLTLTDAYEIRQFVPNADLSSLTPVQITTLVHLLHDGDGFDTAYRIRSILLPSAAGG